MKSVIALIAILGSSVAFANTFKGPFDTTDYNCYDLRKKINLNGQLSLSTDGGKKVTYVGENNNDFSSDEQKVVVFVKTADFKGCPLYTITSK